MITVDVHFNGNVGFLTQVRDLGRDKPIVLQVDSHLNMVNIYLTEGQLDQVAEAIQRHQGKRKSWATAKVIDNQLQEVKLDEKSCLG